MLRRERRLRHNEQFREAMKRGRSYRSDLAVLYVLQRQDTGPARCGITVPRRFGSAVVRNRTRRLFWEAVRAAGVPERGYDLVLVPRSPARGQDYAHLAAGVRQLWCAAGLCREEVSG